jgi:hypothetical protein
MGIRNTTLTKRVKQIIPIEVGDKIAVYHDKANTNSIIWKVQRGNSIVDIWMVKRNTIGVSNTSTITTVADYNATTKPKPHEEEL